MTTPAAVAYWGQRTLNDTQRYVDTVAPLVDSPEVQDVVATRVVEAIQQQVDIEAILNKTFAGVITDRPRLQLLVGPLSAAINGLIDPSTVPVRLLPREQWRILGRPQRRVDTHDVVTGALRYGMDLQIPGTLVAVVARPPTLDATVAYFLFLFFYFPFYLIN